jgi:multidrug efflux pump subunit AcrA (membrane-fusion protein)
MIKKSLLIIPIIASMFALTSCGKPPFGMQGVPVTALTLQSAPVAQSGIYQANLISRHSVSLQPQVAGQIADIYVKAGDHVRAGQLLMVIDKRKQEATLNSTRANALTSNAAISQASDLLNSYQVQRDALISNLDYNKKMYERYNALFSKHSVSQQDYEKYTDSYNKAKADLAANAAQIQAQKSAIIAAKSGYLKAVSDIQEQQVQLQYYKITAPFTGTIGDIPVKVGNYVTMLTPLLNITQNNPLEINVGLPVERVFDIKNGLPIEVLDNYGKVAGKSKVSFIAPNVSTDTQTLLVKAILSNPAGVFKADQSVKVRVIYNQSPGILVPTVSVNHYGGMDFVYILKNKGKSFFVSQQAVKLGDIQGGYYVVINGLKSGDQIVSQGVQKLMDGAPVTILPERK